MNRRQFVLSITGAAIPAIALAAESPPPRPNPHPKPQPLPFDPAQTMQRAMMTLIANKLYKEGATKVNSVLTTWKVEGGRLFVKSSLVVEVPGKPPLQIDAVVTMAEKDVGDVNVAAPVICDAVTEEVRARYGGKPETPKQQPKNPMPQPKDGGSK